MRFAVGHTTFFENVLTIEIVEADNVKEAVMAHSAFNDVASKPEYDLWLKDMPDDLEGIERFFFDGDTLVSATEITEDIWTA